MIFEIVIDNECGIMLREQADYAAWELAKLMDSCGFKNYRVACYDGYENAIEIAKD